MRLRFVYSRLLRCNDQAGRDAGLWLTPHELEKELNAAKNANSSLGFVTTVSKFVAQGACRNYRNAHSRWRNKDLRACKPTFHKKRRTGTGSFLAASGMSLIRYDGHRRIRVPCLGSVKMTRTPPGGDPLRSDHPQKQRTLVRQRRLLEATGRTALPRNSIRRRSRRRHQPPGHGQRRHNIR